jgi:small subunit ribosomal protein S6
MRNYELAYIADPELDTQALKTLEEKVQDWIEAVGGKVLKIDRWGKRRLAYTLRRRNEGYYFFYQFQIPTQASKEMERNLRLNEQVLRYMISVAESAE